jgi:outer membrane protein assembly factor BamB
MRFAVPPHVQFVTPDTALVSWETDQPSESVVAHGTAGSWGPAITDSRPKTTHQLLWRGLEPRTRYQYRIQATSSATETRVSEVYDLDTALNYAMVPVPEGAAPFAGRPDQRRYEQAARSILAATGITRGLCLVLACNEGQLAFELARQSQLVVVGLDTDRDRVERTRALLRKSGVYGSRITLHHAPSLEALPLPQSFANLIVSDDAVLTGRLPGTAALIQTLLQPATGVACLGPLRDATSRESRESVEASMGGAKALADTVKSAMGDWVVARRELPADTGAWTHQYGDAGNTANSREGLQGVAGTDKLEVQWLGRPGADFGIDRNPRMPAPLAVNGRLFHQGLNRMVALDSYNGVVLWSHEIPALRRVNMPRDSGNWCADSSHLFVAVQDRCWELSAATGELLRTRPLVDPGLRTTHAWGFVARSSDLLFGSSVKAGAAYTDFWGEASWYDAKSGRGTEKVCSDDLFAIRRSTGETAWRYRDGVVINSTIGIADGKVLFVECRHPDITSTHTGRIGAPKLWEDQFLVALEEQTGRKLWEQPIDTIDGIVAFYLIAGSDKVVLMASAAGKYNLYAYGSADGKPLWQASHPWTNDNHGGHLQHPVMVRDTVFQEPSGYDAATGVLQSKTMGRHGGCATYAATANALIYRGESGSISMWDMDRGTVTRWHNLRPSCWLSTVAANGMVLSPEGGGGCSCGNWLETSLGFAPSPEAVAK